MRQAVEPGSLRHPPLPVTRGSRRVTCPPVSFTADGMSAARSKLGSRNRSSTVHRPALKLLGSGIRVKADQSLVLFS